MKNLVIVLTFFAIFSCNKQASKGSVKYGKDGVVESGANATGCTYPSKRYTKDLDIKVKASIDSLSSLPPASLDFGVKQTVTRLSDYSSEGLDVDLVLFRLCEMCQNKVFSKEQAQSIFQSAIDAWSKKNSSK